MSEVPHRILNNGVEMPCLGYGVFQIPAAETEQAVSDALEAGYRSIDTAAAYGNEEAVGRAIANSGIPREKLFITTKVWIQDAGEEATGRALATSLERLGLDHLDLYLIHQPFGDYYGSWRSLEKSYDDGVVRAIGVSNFYLDRLVDLMDHSEIKPAVNQVELHPYFQRALEQAQLAEWDVQTEAWAPFAQGHNGIFANRTLSEIGALHGKTVAQVILRWLVQREVVAIPKAVRRERMIENFDIFDFELTSYEMLRIATLDTGSSVFADFRDPEFVRRLSALRID
jgi:2,5-diketo-D-gluconate reductase A